MAVFEVWGTRDRRLYELEGDRVSIGKSEHAELVIGSDPAVSRFHALLERVDSHWCIHDLGSTNGTFINGKRLWREQMLHDGDEVLLGRTRLVYRGRGEEREPETDRLGRAPALTPREQDVLVELCRPFFLSGDPFTPPASDHQIAERLVVTEAAVKQHLARLYDKFDVPEERGTPRRVRLANKAIQAGALGPTDYRDDEPAQ